MKKIFIPTSSLNFNNIMSNASIAPASFYPLRQFGYRRFVSLFNMVDAQNITIGFDKFPIYSMDDSEQQNFPLVIEHCLDDYTDFQEFAIFDDLKLYSIDQTLYFNPSITKFHFLNPQHKDLTLISAQASLETKFVRLFESNILVSDTRSPGTFDLHALPSLHGEIENRKNISTLMHIDLMTEKLRGFTMGFIYGRVNRFDERTIRQLETLRTLNDEISFIKNIYFNFSKSSETNVRKLKSLGDKYGKVWERIDSVIEKCKLLEDVSNPAEGRQFKSFAALLKETRLPGKTIEDINEFLSAFEIELPEKRSTVYQELEKMFRASQSRKTYSVKDIPNILLKLFAPNKYRETIIPKEPFDFIEQTIVELEKKLFVAPNPINSVNLEFNFNYSNCSIQTMNILTLSALENEIAVETLPKLMQLPISNMDEFMNNRLEIAMIIGKEFRNRIDYWDTSEEKRYLNELLNHLQQHTPFDPNGTNSLFLKSLACTLMKGQEIEKLENFLILNKIADHSIAYALWGSIYGLSKFPKNYFDRINPDNQKLVFLKIASPEESQHYVRESESSDPLSRLIATFEKLAEEMPYFRGWKEGHTKSLKKITDEASDMIYLSSERAAIEEFERLIDKKFTANIRLELSKRFNQIWHETT